MFTHLEAKWVGCGPLQAAPWHADSRSRGGAWRSSRKCISQWLQQQICLGGCHSNVCILVACDDALGYNEWLQSLQIVHWYLTDSPSGDMDLEEIVSAHCARLQTQRPLSTDLQSSECVYKHLEDSWNLCCVGYQFMKLVIYNVLYWRNIKTMAFHSFSEV